MGHRRNRDWVVVVVEWGWGMGGWGSCVKSV